MVGMEDRRRMDKEDLWRAVIVVSDWDGWMLGPLN